MLDSVCRFGGAGILLESIMAEFQNGLKELCFVVTVFVYVCEDCGANEECFHGNT